MWTINHAYVNGEFVAVHGSETLEILNPATGEVAGAVTLPDRTDAQQAIAAACRAQQTLGRTTKQERIEWLNRLASAVGERADQMRDATIEEYGAPRSRAQWVSKYASDCFASTARILENYDFTRRIGDTTVVMQPMGVAGLIAPWNSTIGTICSKLASAIAAGCATVIKPSELSPLQTHVIAEALHEARLPPGVFNILVGRGNDVGDEISTNPGVARISFTGSTATGKLIARAALETVKRVSLSMTGKSASIVLPDADFSTAIPLAVNSAFMNNGQACIAGTRLLVPRARQGEVIELARKAVASMRVGDPRDPSVSIGPLFNRKQYDRVQQFIRSGREQGAELIIGGEGSPQGLDRGFFVKPTLFSEVRNDMTIAREEIFGPVLSILTYETVEEAVAIANDSIYGLQAYLFSSDADNARRIALEIQAGSVLINRIAPDLIAPFGGVKESGTGREFGVFGMEAFLEPKSITGE